MTMAIGNWLRRGGTLLFCYFFTLQAPPLQSRWKKQAVNRPWYSFQSHIPQIRASFTTALLGDVLSKDITIIV